MVPNPAPSSAESGADSAPRLGDPVGHGGVHAAAGAADHGLAGHRNNDSHGRRDDLVVAAMIKAAAAAILLAAVWPNMTAAADEPSAGAPAPPPPSADPTKLLLGDIGGLRSELTKRGIIPAVTEIEEFLGNVSGGVRQA